MIARRAADVLMRHTPRFYGIANRFRRQVLVEARVLRQLGISGVLGMFSRKRDEALSELPVQSVPVVRTDLPSIPGKQDFLEVAKASFGSFDIGGHAIYLSPEQLASSSLAGLMARYPGNAGIKIVRNEGAAESGQYIRGDTHSRLQMHSLESAERLMLVANALYIHGVGARIYDTITLQSGSSSWLAYIVEHAPGKPSLNEGADCVKRLVELVQQGELRLVIPFGFEHPDFLPPDFAGNIRVSASGRACYIDFQNFVVPDYARFLRKLAQAAAEASHFGDRSMLRGGRYLYQEVPGVGMAAKRGVRARMAVIEPLMRTAGLDLAGRLVFDFGCNIGMMMAEYLRRGAHWCLGRDLPHIVRETERLLLALGCTRFSTIGGKLSPDVAPSTVIPDFLRPIVGKSVVSYLAVRGHFGWLQDLKAIPWEFMIYEGHEGESEPQSVEFLRQFHAMVPSRVVASATYSDGDSRPRYLAILERLADPQG